MYTHDLTEGLGGWRYGILYYTKSKLTTEGVWQSHVHHVTCYDVVIIETEISISPILTWVFKMISEISLSDFNYRMCVQRVTRFTEWRVTDERLM